MKSAVCDRMLRCLHVNGGIRYELPARLIGERGRYILYHRPCPEVIHHTKKKTFVLPYPEMVFVGDSGTHHCVSVALDAYHRAVNMYVNINLPPEPHQTGHEWRDLELDIKLTRGADGDWKPIVVDVEEFEQADLPPELRQIALQEVDTLLQTIREEQFPFMASGLGALWEETKGA